MTNRFVPASSLLPASLLTNLLRFRAFGDAFTRVSWVRGGTRRWWGGEVGFGASSFVSLFRLFKGNRAQPSTHKYLHRQPRGCIVFGSLVAASIV